MQLTTNGVELYYRVEGQGDPALVMHGGLGVDHTPFVNSSFNTLADRLKLVYYDHRCNGRSGCPGIESLTHENLATDAEGLRVALGLEQPTVIGHSYGGFVALEYALRYSSKPRRLILITTAPSYETLNEARAEAMSRAPELMPAVERSLNAEAKNNAERRAIMAELAPLYCYNFKEMEKKLGQATRDIVYSVEAHRQSFKNLVPKYDVRSKLDSIDIPVLIICGRHDWITPVSQSQLMLERLPNSELVIFENSAHWVYVEEPELFQETVGDWLDRT